MGRIWKEINRRRTRTHSLQLLLSCEEKTRLKELSQKHKLTLTQVVVKLTSLLDYVESLEAKLAKYERTASD
jgi:hypothetical protein